MGGRRSIRGLVGGTIAYWIVVAAVKLGPAAFAIYRATRGPKDSSSVNVSLGNGGFSLNVIEKGVTTYTASASLITIAAWIALPPLIGWVAWAVLRRRPAEFRVLDDLEFRQRMERRKQRNDGNPD